MSTETDATDAAFAAAVSGPRRVKGDAGEVEQQPIPDLIAADRYAAAKAAMSTRRRGLRITKLRPPGTV